MAVRVGGVNGLVPTALPAMERLVGAGETVLLARRFGHTILVLEVVTGEPGPPTIGKGAVYPLEDSLFADVLLAFTPETDIDELAAAHHSRPPTHSSSGAAAPLLSRRSLADPADPRRARLAHIRRCGYAASWEEGPAGLAAVSRPLLREASPRAVLLLLAPTALLTPATAEAYAGRLGAAIAQIEAELAEPAA